LTRLDLTASILSAPSLLPATRLTAIARDAVLCASSRDGLREHERRQSVNASCRVFPHASSPCTT
jgi:hypothetical protein